MKIRKIYNYYWIAYFFTLGMSSLQATQEESGERMFTVNFWTIKEDSEERLLEEDEYDDTLAQNIEDNKVPSQYCKRSYSVKEYTPIWPTAMRIIKEMNIPSITSFLDLQLLEKAWEWSDKKGNGSFKYYFRVVNRARNFCDKKQDVIITRVKEEHKKKIKLTVREGDQNLLEKELSIHPDTTIQELAFYVKYDSNVAKEKRNTFREEDYKVFYGPNESSGYNEEIGNKKVGELATSEIAFYRPSYSYTFYTNQDGSLLSEDQVNSSKKIEKGINGDWKPTQVSVLGRALLWPIVDQLLPGESAINIDFKQITEEEGKYKVEYIRYYRSKKSDDFQEPRTVNAYQALGDANFVLLKYKKDDTADVRCILKQEGNDRNIKEKTINIGKDTSFLEAYLHLIGEAGFVVKKSIYESFYGAKYTVRGKPEEKIHSIWNDNLGASSPMLQHSQEKKVDAYIFTMPESARLTSKEQSDKLTLPANDHTRSTTITTDSSNSCIVEPNSQNDPIKYNEKSNNSTQPTSIWETLIPVIILVATIAVGGLVYWIWQAKKSTKKKPS